VTPPHTLTRPYTCPLSAPLRRHRHRSPGREEGTESEARAFCPTAQSREGWPRVGGRERERERERQRERDPSHTFSVSHDTCTAMRSGHGHTFHVHGTVLAIGVLQMRTMNSHVTAGPAQHCKRGIVLRTISTVLVVGNSYYPAARSIQCRSRCIVVYL